MKETQPSRTVFTLILSAVMACGGGQAEKTAAEAKAKADAEKKAADALAAKRRADREAEEKAKKEAEEKAAAEIDTLAQLPEKLPKNLGAACKAVAAAQDTFMQKQYEGDALDKYNQAKGTQLKMTEVSCTKMGSLQAAACQVYAFEHATMEQKDKVPDFMRRCNEKFGAQGAGAADSGGGAPPPK